jgi:hypothetical protein
MSLINEALKKAQKQQSEAAAKEQRSIGGPPATPPPPPVKPPKSLAEDGPDPDSDQIFGARRQRSDKKFKSALIWVGGIIGLVVVGFIFLSRSDDQAHEVAKLQTPIAPASRPAETAEAPGPTRTQSEVEVTKVVEPEPPQPVESKVAIEPSVAFNLPKAEPVPAPAPEALIILPVAAKTPPNTPPRNPPNTVSQTVLAVQSSLPPIARSTEPPVLSSPVVKNVPMPTATTQTVVSPLLPVADPIPDRRSLQREPLGKVIIADSNEPTARGVTPQTPGATVANEAILNYLERVRVTGIRVSETDPKVLMNNRVYRLNEIVDRDLKLRITKISPRELLFQDALGHVYRKVF